MATQMRKAVAYIDAKSEDRSKEQRRTVRVWASRHAFRIMSFYSDPIGTRSNLPSLKRALASCRRNGAILLVAKSDVLMRSARFCSHAANAVSDGLMICSTDLASLADLPPERQTTIWGGIFEMSMNRRKNPRGARRDETSLRDEEEHLAGQVEIFVEVYQRGLDDAEFAFRLNAAGHRLPGGTEFKPRNAKRVRRKIRRMLRDFVIDQGP